MIANPLWKTFVNIEQYEKLVAGEGHTLAFHSVLQPSILRGFGSVFIAAAMFEDTMIYRLWSQSGVQFVPDHEFAYLLRYTTHPNGQLVTLHYATEDRWSRSLRTKKIGEGTALDLLLRCAKQFFEPSGFLWQANANYRGNPLTPGGIRLPNKPHGLNTYSTSPQHRFCISAKSQSRPLEVSEITGSI